jgi:hypothetical protein
MELNLKAILETIGLSASVTAVLGYVSLRSYLNYLGIAGAVEFTIDQLLYEAYVVGSQLLIGIILVLLAGCLVAVSGWIAARLAPRSVTRFVTTFALRIRVWLQHGPAIWSIVLSAAILFAVLLKSAAGPTGILLFFAKSLAAVSQQPVLFLLCVIAAVSFTGFFISISLLKAEPAGPVTRIVFRFSATCICLGLVLIATIAFNVHSRSTRFPLVALTDRTDKTGTCGLLVYSTSKQWMLWNLRSTLQGVRGTVSVRARKDEDQLQVLALVDARRIAAISTDSANPAITCESTPVGSSNPGLDS